MGGLGRKLGQSQKRSETEPEKIWGRAGKDLVQSQIRIKPNPVAELEKRTIIMGYKTTRGYLQ